MMTDQVAAFLECSRAALTSDLPQIAAKLGDERDPVAELSYATYFSMVEALRAAHALIDGTDEDSIRVRAQIERALCAAGEVVVA